MKEMYSVRHGGLMRCCLLALDDAMVMADEPPKEGDRLKCRYCPTWMQFEGGSWRSAARIERQPHAAP